MSLPKLLLIVVALLAVAGCKQVAATRENPAPPQPVRISAPGIDAAEPTTAAAPDGTFYVAWVNHDSKQADVMLARASERLHDLLERQHERHVVGLPAQAPPDVRQQPGAPRA